MSALPSKPPILTVVPSTGAFVRPDELAGCVRALDPGSRALLDLSLRRRLPFEAMAVVLRTDPFDLARRRARAIARIAADLDLDGPGVVACVRAALAQLPEEAWGVPLPASREPVQAEVMAEAARALMLRLRKQRAESRKQKPEADAEAEARAQDQPAVGPPSWVSLPRAAAAEREATLRLLGAYAGEDGDEVVEPVAVMPDVVESSAETIEFEAVSVDAPPAVEPTPGALIRIDRPRRRKLIRGGFVFALVAALLRFLFRR